jgi:hypothetical protein
MLNEECALPDFQKLATAHCRLDALFNDQLSEPHSIQSVAEGLDTLSRQTVIACKLLREENRLLRKERKLILTDKKTKICNLKE